MQPALFDLPAMALPSTLGRAVVSAMASGHVLNKGQGSTKDYDFTLNAYRGCGFACSYCYAAAFVPDERRRAEWGRWIEVKTQAIDEVRVKKLYNKSIFMSSATDPYQPLELKLELTRGIVHELVKVQARLVVQTRSPICTRDIDLFQQLKHVRVNISITTDDDAIRKEFEPSCPSIGRRLEAIQMLKEAGIRTSVCICPMLPMRDPESFARTLNKIGPDHVSMGWFHDSDKPFAADTRDPAWPLLKRYKWTQHEFQLTKETIMRNLRGIQGRGFAPV